MDHQNSACSCCASNQPGNMVLRRTNRLYQLCISNCQRHSISAVSGCADYLLGEEWADFAVSCIPHQPHGTTNAGSAFADGATVCSLCHTQYVNAENRKISVDIFSGAPYSNNDEQQYSLKKCPATSSADHLCQVHHDLNGGRNAEGANVRPFSC